MIAREELIEVVDAWVVACGRGVREFPPARPRGEDGLFHARPWRWTWRPRREDRAAECRRSAADNDDLADGRRARPLNRNRGRALAAGAGGDGPSSLREIWSLARGTTESRRRSGHGTLVLRRRAEGRTGARWRSKGLWTCCGARKARTGKSPSGGRANCARSRAPGRSSKRSLRSALPGPAGHCRSAPLGPRGLHPRRSPHRRHHVPLQEGILALHHQLGFARPAPVSASGGHRPRRLGRSLCHRPLGEKPAVAQQGRRHVRKHRRTRRTRHRWPLQRRPLRRLRQRRRHRCFPRAKPGTRALLSQRRPGSSSNRAKPISTSHCRSGHRRWPRRTTTAMDCSIFMSRPTASRSPSRQNVLATEFLSEPERAEWKRRRAEDHPVFRLTGPPNVLLVNKGAGKFARAPEGRSARTLALDLPEHLGGL